MLFSPLDPPTSLERLARLERFDALPGRVRGTTGMLDNDDGLSAEVRVGALLDIRGGYALAMVDALLVSEGTSSTEPRVSNPWSPMRNELRVARSVIDEVAVCSRGFSKEDWLKSGVEIADESRSGAVKAGLGAGKVYSIGAEAGLAIENRSLADVDVAPAPCGVLAGTRVRGSSSAPTISIARLSF